MAKRRVQVEWYGDDVLAVVRKHGDAALFAAGEVVQAAAEQRAPRGATGRLRGSGYVSTASRSTYKTRRYWRREKKPPAGAATVGFSAPHAHLLEGGRRKSGAIRPRRKRALRIDGQFRSASRYRRMSSRPFLGPAIDATKESMVDALAGVLNKALERELPK